MLSFRTTIIATILVATIGSGGTVAAFLLSDLYETTSDGALRELDLRAGQTAAVLERHLDANLSRLSSLAHTSDMALGVVSALFESEAMELANLYIKDHPLVSRVYLVDKARTHVIAAPRDGNQQGLAEATAMIEEMTDEDPEAQLIVINRPEPALAYITPLLLHKNNRSKSQELTGFLVALIPTSRLLDRMHQQHLSTTGLELILNGQPLIVSRGNASHHDVVSKRIIAQLPEGNEAEITVSAESSQILAGVKTRLWETVGYVLLLVVSMLTLAFLVARSLSQALVDMKTVIDSFADGEFKSTLQVGRFAEFRQLKALIDAMNKTTEDYRRRSVELSRQAAVGEMVQMLAHDVRKPFSLVRMGLNMMQVAKNEGEIRMILQKLAPRVAQAIRSVNAMLDDTMAVSQRPQINREAIALETLIEECIGELTPVLNESAISFSYQLDFRPTLNIDTGKMRRVLTNIIDNAVQATNRQGRIWFKATAIGDGAEVELVVGNSGSFIPEELRQRIFETFFTHGKKGGTGLGLAVAKSFVELHGGRISCRSSQEVGTEFIITLPLALNTAIALPQAVAPEAALPTAQPNYLGIKAANNFSSKDGPFSPLELEMVEVLKRRLLQMGGPFKILLVDDEPFYLMCLTALIEETTAACRGIAGPQQIHLQVQTAESVRQARDIGAAGTFALGIFDFDLGDPDVDGFMLLEELQGQGRIGLGAIHSNRLIGQLNSVADAPARLLLYTKPISRPDLLRLLVSASEMALRAVA